jgi:hypothetical protein
MRLIITPEHLQTDGHGSTGLFQGTNRLQLHMVMALVGVNFSDKNESGFNEVFCQLRQRENLAVRYPMDSFNGRSVTPQEKDEGKQ